jgi:hypothetical protein
MIVVISPAKKLDFETPAPTKKFTKPVDLKKSEELIKELRKCKPQEISKLMKLSDDLTELNVKRYKNFTTPFNLKNAKQAMFAFKGDTYVGLDADTMGDKEIEFAQNHLRILSGLYGLVSPLDLVQPYRLEMGTKFPVGDKKNLYEFWRDNITDQLNDLLKKEKVLVNCASNEYFKSIDTKKLDAKIITPAFKEKKGDEYKMVGFFAKKARGMMSRYIIENQIKDPKDILGFDTDGYKYNKKLSSELEPVFTR